MKYKDTRAPVGSLDVAAPGGLVPLLSRFAFRRLRALEAENYKSKITSPRLCIFRPLSPYTKVRKLCVSS